MNTPHISAIGIPKTERMNNNQNDAITLGQTRKFNTNQNAISPTPTKDEAQLLVHPYKLNNFRNEYTKDVSNIFCDPCLSPEYERLYNIKDRRYRGNQFAPRHFNNDIFNRNKYNFIYKNTRLNQQYPVIMKKDPWFQANWSSSTGDLTPLSESDNIINNRQDINNANFQSHPYYFYRGVHKENCNLPIVQLPHFLEQFANNTNNKAWILYIIMPLILIAISKIGYIKL